MTALEIAKQVPGSLTQGDMDLLDKMAREVPEGGLAVEIGCYYGKSTCITYHAKHPSVTLYTIDAFVGTEVDPAPDQYKKMIDNMSKFKFYPIVIFGKSWEQAHLFKDGSIDYIFIDGCHSEEAVTQDIAAFLPKMKPGGLMSGHDHQTYLTINRAIAKFFPDSRVVLNHQNESSIWRVRI